MLTYTHTVRRESGKLLFICYALAILLSGCTEKGSVKIVVAESSLSVPASLSFIARQKGFWKDQGLDVSVVSFTAGRLALDAMLNGQAQFATAAETPLATGAFRHNTYAIICEMMNTTTETKIVARKDAGISTPQSLKGKKVGVFVGTQAEYFMDAFLTHNGMQRSELNVVNLQPADLVTAIVKGDIDAMVVWQPYAFNALKLLGTNAVVFPNEGIYTGMFCMATLRKYANENPEVVEKFLKGLIDAEKFVQQHPDEAIEIVAKQVGIDPANLKQFYGEYKFVVKISDVLLDGLKKEGEWAIKTGVTPANSSLPDYHSFIYDKPLKNIFSDRVSILEK